MQKFKRLYPILFVVAAVLYMAGPGCGRGPIDTEHMFEIGDDTFAEVVEQADGWVLVDFWATWCGPCRAMMPELDQVAADYAGRVTFTKLDVDENPVIAERFNIGSIPHVYLFYRGRPVDGFLGYRNRAQIAAWMEAVMASNAEGSTS